MQTLLDTVRATGAKNVVIAGGLDWAYDMSGFLEGKQLADPTGNGVIYANHAYPFKGDTVERWLAKMEKASKVLPVIVSEFGSDPKGGRGLTGEQWVRQVLQALEDHGWSWTAWDLHPGAGPCLISDWKYTPTPSFGSWVKQCFWARCFADVAFRLSSRFGDRTQRPAQRSESLKTMGTWGPFSIPGPSFTTRPRQSYTVAGSGENMWSTRDAFHYVWKKATGDVALAADISFVGTGREAHRKACLVIRQGLDADSAYVDVALHGDGLTSLQFRDAKGAATHEVQANVSAPRRLRIVKRGKYVVMDLAAEGEEPSFSGAAVRITFRGAVLRRPGRLRAQQRRDGDGGFLECGTGCAPCRCDRLAGVVQHARDADDLINGSPRRSCHDHADRSAQLAARRQRAHLQQRRPDFPHARGRRDARGHRYRLRHALQQRPRRLAGWNPAGDQRPVAGAAAVAHLYAADHGGNARAGHAVRPIVLARLVAGRQDAGLLR